MDFSVFSKIFPLFLQGTLITIELAISALIFGTLIGIFLALFKISHIKILNFFSSFYIWFFRGTPLLLQVMFIYFAMPGIGLELSPFAAGALSLSLNLAAYMAEAIRGGIISIDTGQFEASKALGFTYVQTMTKIILPQTIRVILPAVGNLSVSMLKDTSLVSAISLAELMRQAQQVYSTTFKLVEPFSLAAIFYLLLTTIFTKVYGMIEKKLAVY